MFCDIGNTTYTFFKNGDIFKKNIKDFDPLSIKEKIYYISVNHAINKKLSTLSNWIDLEEKIDKNRYYKTMGIDRIMACEAVYNGVIVDAGSAITVDVVKEAKFIGGFIYPGIKAFKKAFSDISPALDYDFDFRCDFETLPKDTVCALSYGFLAGLKKEVESNNLDIILTGGDAKILKNVFKQAKIDEVLIFRGMQKVLKEKSR
jgi:type III pantothenate kinase